MRHILLSTIGESPQVVTETLYGIHKNDKSWPDTIRIITTTIGAERAMALLDQKHLEHLCHEIGRPMPRFSKKDILIVPNAKGKPVDDARSLEDHEALADFIINQLRELTADPDVTVHASLAGGRKTMTFYLGYAMSLFGRSQDFLSHVLISKGYEGLPSFWYPSASPTPLTGRDGQPLTHADGHPMRASDAVVTLAPIPFIRQRNELPKLLKKEGDAISFRTLVRLFNLAEHPEDIYIKLNFRLRCITLYDAREEMHPVTLQLDLPEFAFYAMIARATLHNDTTLKRPGKDKPDEGLLKRYLDELLPLCGLSITERAIDALDELEEQNDESQVLSDRMLRELRGEDWDYGKKRDIGMTQTWFDARKNAIKNLFEEHLPPRLVERLTPRPAGKDGKSRKGGTYRIDLHPLHIGLEAEDTPRPL